MALHKGKGSLRDTVDGVRSEDEETRGLGALHLAAASGKVDMCRYLVEVLRLDVDAVDHQGYLSFPSQGCGSYVKFSVYGCMHAKDYALQCVPMLETHYFAVGMFNNNKRSCLCIPTLCTAHPVTHKHVSLYRTSPRSELNPQGRLHMWLEQLNFT
jgi:hypothetical protein